MTLPQQGSGLELRGKQNKVLTRSQFIKRKSGILKAISIFITVLISIALVFVLLYSKFGISGFSGLLGLEKQQNLNTEELIPEEADYLKSEFGFDLDKIKPGELTGKKYLKLRLSAAGMTKVINTFLKDPEVLTNLQIEVSDDQTLKLSAVGNVDLILSAFGESKQFVESSLGKLPDDVPVYVELLPGKDETASEILELKVGAVKIPRRLVGMIEPYVGEGLDMLFDNTMDIQLDKLYIDGDDIVLEGRFPG